MFGLVRNQMVAFLTSNYCHLKRKNGRHENVGDVKKKKKKKLGMLEFRSSVCMFYKEGIGKKISIYHMCCTQGGWASTQTCIEEGNTKVSNLKEGEK